MARFFVSYSRSDKDEVSKVVSLLSAADHEVWWDNDIPVMDDWWRSILTRIEWCEVFIFVVSEKSVQSDYCLAELKYANERQRPILPFILQDPSSLHLPSFLPHRAQWLLYDGDPARMLSQINAAYRAINWSIHKDLDVPRPPEPKKGGKSIARMYQQARQLANEQRFAEAKLLFQDIKVIDFEQWGTDCDEWIARLVNYEQVVELVEDPSTLGHARQAWKKHVYIYGEEFDPYPIKPFVSRTRSSRNPRIAIALFGIAVVAVTLLFALPLLDNINEVGTMPSDTPALAIAPSYTTGSTMTSSDAFAPSPTNTFTLTVTSSRTNAPTQTRTPTNTPNPVTLPSNATVDDLLLLADQTQANEDYVTAIGYYSEVIRLDPVNIGAYYGRGQANYALENFENSIDDFSRVIELNPNYLDARKRRGDALFGAARYSEAVIDYDAALARNPRSLVILNMRGRALAALGDYSSAIESFTTALEIDPSYAIALNNRGYAYYDIKEYEKAIEDFTRYIEIDQEWSTAYALRGLSYMELGNYAAALEDLNQAILLDGSEIDYFNRGSLYLRQQEFSLAANDFKRATEIDPTYAAAYSFLGYSYDQQGLVRLALEAYKQHLQLAGSEADQYVIDRVKELE